MLRKEPLSSGQERGARHADTMRAPGPKVVHGMAGVELHSAPACVRDLLRRQAAHGQDEAVVAGCKRPWLAEEAAGRASLYAIAEPKGGDHL